VTATEFEAIVVVRRCPSPKECRRVLCVDSSIADLKSTNQRYPDNSSLPFHLPPSWAVLREPQMRSGASYYSKYGLSPLWVPSTRSFPVTAFSETT
jgi:hypothetical protein